MASVTLHPDPTLFPIGTKVKVYEEPANSPSGWKPSGSALSEPEVESSGTLKVEGLTEGKRYVGEATVSGTRHTLGFAPAAAEAEGEVLSVNGKTGAVTLTASDVEAVGTVSPSFSGVPKTPTAAVGTNTTQIASTAYSLAAAVKAKEEAEAAAKTQAELAQSAAESAATTKANTAQSNAETAAASKDSTAKTSILAAAETKDEAVQAAAEAAAGPRQKVHALVSASGTLGANEVTPVSAEAAERKMKLPTGQAQGAVISVEKADASANKVVVEGSIRGVAESTLSLSLSKQTVGFTADAEGSWWPTEGHVPLGDYDARYRLASTAIVARTPHAWVERGSVTEGTLPGLVVIPASGETVKAVRIDYKIREGTKVTFKIQRVTEGGEASDLTGFTSLEATKTAAHKEPTAVTIASGEELILVISAVEGTPKGFSATIQLSHSV